MSRPAESLHPDMIGQLIQRHRGGERIALLCHHRFDGFSPSNVYFIQKICAGNSLEVTDDDGDVIVLDDTYPSLGCFTVPKSVEHATEISSEMKKGFVAALSKRVAALIEKHSFVAGDVVCWKDGCQVSTHPALGSPAVVIEILKEPRTCDDAHLLDPHATLRCDMVIASDGPDGQLITTLADSRRFKPYSVQTDTLRATLGRPDSPTSH